MLDYDFQKILELLLQHIALTLSSELQRLICCGFMRKLVKFAVYSPAFLLQNTLGIQHNRDYIGAKAMSCEKHFRERRSRKEL